MTGATNHRPVRLRLPALRRVGKVFLLVAALAGIAIGQWSLLFGPSRILALAVWLSGLGAFLWLERSSRDAPIPAPDKQHTDGSFRPFTASLAQGRYLVTPLMIAGSAGSLAATLQHRIDRESDHLVVVLAWLLSLTAVFVAATPPGFTRTTSLSVVARLRAARFAQWAPAATIFAIAAAARFVSLGTFPVAESDGLSMARVGREVINGQARNPFGTGWFDNPALYSFVQAGSMQVFGQTLFGVRFVSALVGTLAVVATFFWTRHFFGRTVALAASALLAVLPMSIYFSRVGLNLIEDSLSLVLVLWLLDRAFVHRRPLDAVLAGLALGLAQYFYFSARFLVPLALALSCAMAIWWFARLRSWSGAVRAVAGPIGWMWGAALLACLPLAVHFIGHPETFNSRGRQVSATGPWLQQEVARTGDSEAQIISRQLGNTALLPFATRPGGHYHPDPPLVGWPMAPPVAVGLAMVTTTAWRRRHMGIAMAWWGALGAVGLTIGFHAQRWILATPLIAVCAALGIDALRRVVVTHLRVPERFARFGMIGFVLGLMAWNAHFAFRDSNEPTVWADGNSIVAATLAEQLADEPSATAVFTAFAPRMFFASHSVVPFLAPQVAGNDLLDPVVELDDVPEVNGRTIFAFLPERLGELTVVRRVHPGGTTDEFFDRSGRVMLVLYTVDL